MQGGASSGGLDHGPSQPIPEEDQTSMTSGIVPGNRPISHPFFTRAQQELLTLALDRIVPPEGDLPGAGALGLAAFVENATGASPQQRRLFIDGLAQIEIAAARLSGAAFSGLSGDDRDAALRDVESRSPVFFDALVRQCYNGYYTNPQVRELVGYRRLSPSEYEYQPLDETLLEPQRQRAPFWTRV